MLNISGLEGLEFPPDQERIIRDVRTQVLMGEPLDKVRASLEVGPFVPEQVDLIVGALRTERRFMVRQMAEHHMSTGGISLAVALGIFFVSIIVLRGSGVILAYGAAIWGFFELLYGLYLYAKGEKFTGSLQDLE